MFIYSDRYCYGNLKGTAMIGGEESGIRNERKVDNFDSWDRIEGRWTTYKVRRQKRFLSWTKHSLPPVPAVGIKERSGSVNIYWKYTEILAVLTYGLSISAKSLTTFLQQNPFYKLVAHAGPLFHILNWKGSLLISDVVFSEKTVVVYFTRFYLNSLVLLRISNVALSAANRIQMGHVLLRWL